MKRMIEKAWITLNRLLVAICMLIILLAKTQKEVKEHVEKTYIAL